MKLHKKLLILISLVVFSGNVYAGAASSKLSALADSLIKGYTAKAGASKAVLAVFPLYCEGKLEKQRVGFAASEIMSHRFVSNGAFTVLERSELGKLLSEQKLQVSGAVDNETAVKLGKVLGAGVILVGNVQKVAGKYQVNARLVNAETAEVLASGYEELASSAFEEDARSYLNLVPDEQALGLYFFYSSRNNSNDLPDTSYSDPYNTVNVLPAAFNSGLAGGGIKYQPTARLVLDFSISGTTSKIKAGTWQYNSFGNGWSRPHNLSIAVVAYRALAALRLKVLDSLLFYPGLGATAYSITGSAKGNYLTPTIHARIEFLPQSRIGVSLAGGYDLSREAAYATTPYGSGPANKCARLNRFYLEPAFSLYF